ncbi:MAG: redoxin domain-containing protein [Acidobacteriia bacterium]|nr:redoxin domain-containing protein [Terriglobia bacterium]
MKTYRVAFGALLAILLVVGLYFVNRYWIAPATQRHAAKATSGDRPMAPAFSLTDLNGRKINLADERGKVVLLDFWATWCGPCQLEIPGFVKLQERYRDQGLVVIGVSMDDSVEPVRDFYREFKMNYAVAMGDQRIGELYGGIIGLPTTFLIGRDGHIYAKHTGATDISVFEDEIKTLLAADANSGVAELRPVGGTRPQERIELGDPAEIDSEVPGVNLSKLNPQQVAMFKKQLETLHCDCGCKLTILRCRQIDRACNISRRVAREQLEKFLKPSV